MTPDAPGVQYADPLAPATMRMSEALGNAGAEGKTLNFTEADRSRVFGPNRGGVGFSGLQHYSLPHQQANTVWGFGKKSVAEKKIRQNDPENTLFTTFVGSPQQHKSNSVVIGDAIKEFQKSVKKGDVPREQIMLMNKRLNEVTDDKTGAKIFEEGFDLTDPSALNVANTFARRAAVGDVMLGVGVKGPMVRLEFKKEFPNTKFVDASNIENILKRETDPDLVDAGTYDVGNRLFVMDGKIIERPDLNEAFPIQVTGSDLGMKYQLVPPDKAMRDFYKAREGRKNKHGDPSLVSYYDLARAEPSQLVDEDYLTFLQKEGYAKGGEVDGDQELKAMIADHLESQRDDPELRSMIEGYMAGGEVGMAGGGKMVKKAFKKLFADAPQADALKLAQERAALPPAKGGLGLPKNNTPEQRAKAMGFDRDTYHGSFRDIKKLDPSVGSTESHAGKGIYSTDSAEDASRNYASIYGPDPIGRVERGMEARDKDFRKIHSRMRDETLTPRQQEIILRNTVDADNLGVVYPLKVRSDKSIHLDAPESNPVRIGPFERYDEATDTYVDTPYTAKFNEALNEFRDLGGEANPIYDLVQDYGDVSVPARDVFNVVKKTGNESGLYDPFTGDIVSGGVAAGDFMKNFGIDEIRHTPQFRSHELNIGKEHTISMNPDNVRSRFAAFDPFRKSAAIAASMGVAAPDLLAKETKEKKKADGGKIVKGAVKGFKKLFADDVLPAAEREANLAKMMESSKVKDRLYHGTDKDFSEFKFNPKKSMGTWLTNRPKLASAYSEVSARGGDNSVVYPLYAQIKNPASEKDFMDARDIAQAQSGTGGWHDHTIRHKQLLLDKGFDGVKLKDGTYIAFEPTQIKSAIGNRGTYDTNEADITKAHGGLAMAKGGKMVKGLKRLFSDPAESSTASRGTRKFEDGAGGLNITKEPGGNWLTGSVGSVERALQPLKRDEFIDVPQLQDPATAALNKWVDSNLTNYVKKQMATKDDPVRKLAEEGIVHMPPRDIVYNMHGAQKKRAELGQPQLGQSEAAKAWENNTDALIDVAPAGEYTKPLTPTQARRGDRSLVDTNPWLEKVAPETPINAISGDAGRNLGFDHILDVLREDVTSGRMRPEQLNKVSMEQAVRRTHEYDLELAAKMNAANAAKREGLPVYKDYPEGYRWIELNKPGSFSAESDMMGHSVRGYEPPKGHPDWVEGSGNSGSLSYGHGGWEAIKSGKAKVYSLVDSKGAPHATVEVAENPQAYPVSGEAFAMLPSETKAKYSQYVREWRQRNPDVEELTDEHTAQALREAGVKPKPPIITQIKGKGNAAPKEDYLPFVQDFVKSGEWSDVGDLSNTGLSDVGGRYFTEPELVEAAKKYGRMGVQDTSWDVARQRHIDAGIPEEEALNNWVEGFREGRGRLDIPPEGMAKGGGAFKTLQWSQPKGFDGGGIASPDENLTYESKPSRFSKVASEMYDETKQGLANDYERLKNSGSARAQLAKIAALQMAGGAPDLAHLGVDFVLDPLKSVTVDKLFTKPRPRSVLEGPAKAGEKRDRVPMFGSIGEALTTKDGLPMGGSEHLIRRAQEAGLLYGKNIPIYDVNGNLAIDPETDEPYESRSGRFSLPTEIGGAILGGGALSKMRKVAGKKYQKFAEPRVDPAGALSRAIRADSDAMFNQNLRAR